MYPFATKAQWLVSGRYSHILQAMRSQPVPHDSVLHRRLLALSVWNKARAAVLVLLSLGVAATVASFVGGYLPGFSHVADLFDRLTAAGSAVSGFLTLVVLVLTRLLNQIEADILCILTLEGPPRPSASKAA